MLLLFIRNPNCYFVNGCSSTLENEPSKERGLKFLTEVLSGDLKMDMMNVYKSHLLCKII